MRDRNPDELLRRIRALPAGRPLMAALADQPGVYLVGGAVRDLLRDGEPFDLDLVVEGDPVAVARKIGDPVVVHDRFGTSSVAADGFSYDVGRARRETYSRPGALPDVTPADLRTDLGRRDFTVNALAIALGGAQPGDLLAFPGGLEDLQDATLRILHDGSFLDDPTRLFRLARYRGRLGFSIDPHTRELADRAVRGDALQTVSGPRIGNELRHLAAERDPVGAFRALRELGLDHAVHPGFGVNDEELTRRALALLPPEDVPDRLILAAASREIPGDELRTLLDRLGFEAEDRHAIISAATTADALSRRLAATRRPSEVAEAALGAGTEAVALAGALGAEVPAREWLNELSRVKLEIDGRDLLAAGVPEGPALGRALRTALAAKLDGVAHGREQELAVALRTLRDSS